CPGWDYRVEETLIPNAQDQGVGLDVRLKETKVAILYRTEEETDKDNIEAFLSLCEETPSGWHVKARKRQDDDKIPVHVTPDGRLYIKPSDLFSLPSVQELILKIASKQITRKP